MVWKTKSSYVFLFAKEGLSTDDIWGARGTVWRYGWELVSKPAISLQKFRGEPTVERLHPNNDFY